MEDIPLDDVEAGDGLDFALVGCLIVEIAVSMSIFLDAVLEAHLWLVECPIAGLGVAKGLLSVGKRAVSFRLKRVACRCLVELILGQCSLSGVVKVITAEVDGEDSAYFGGLLQVLAAGGGEEFWQAAHEIILLRKI